MAADAIEQAQRRLERIERALEAQRAYIRRVQDPDNRYRAETNLFTLLEMRSVLEDAYRALLAQQGSQHEPLA